MMKGLGKGATRAGKEVRKAGRGYNTLRGLIFAWT